MDAAQAGAAAERTARAAAEASLSDARVSLQQTNEQLQESLANGSTAALAALLEEKGMAEAKAREAVAAAEAATKERNEAKRELARRVEEVSFSRSKGGNNFACNFSFLLPVS